jgi:AraC family transcriptional regulator
MLELRNVESQPCARTDISLSRPTQSGDLCELGLKRWGSAEVRVQKLEGGEDFCATMEPDRPTLLVMLEEVGGRAEVHLRRSGRGATPRGRRGPLTLLPSGVSATETAPELRYLRQAVISFDEDGVLATKPRLMFTDRRVFGLASMLAAEVLSEDPLEPVYGESLGIAVLASLTGASDERAERSGLVPLQLKRVTEYMTQRSAEPIHLDDMAKLLGVSQSHFSRAFKVSTGISPYRWLLNLRVAVSQKLLLDTQKHLTEVALTAGFCEQGHLTRAFRAVTGTTPAAWRKARCSRSSAL